MTHLTQEHFADVNTGQKLHDILATGFGLDGEPGTAEYANDAVDALRAADDDIFWDYAEFVSDNGFAATAASHVNISRLQVGAAYARTVLAALARNPDLLAQVHASLAKPTSEAPPEP